jgi:hypothetical protein
LDKSQLILPIQFLDPPENEGWGALHPVLKVKKWDAQQ